jgi:hypothetical protein
MPREKIRITAKKPEINEDMTVSIIRERERESKNRAIYGLKQGILLPTR